MDNNFEDSNQLIVNDKPYNIHKIILTTTLEYFKIAYSNKFSEFTNSIYLDTIIDFNIILNIISYNFYGSVYGSIVNVYPNDFIDVIQILSYFGAKNNLISDLIKIYGESNTIPLDHLYERHLASNDVNNGVKYILIQKIKNCIDPETDTKIEINQTILNHIKMFKIQFNDDEINEMSKLISHKMMKLWIQNVVKKYDHSQDLVYATIKAHIIENGLLQISLLDDRFCNITNKNIGDILNKIGFDSPYDMHVAVNYKKNTDYDVKLEVKNVIIASFNSVIEVPIFDILATYMLQQLLQLPY